MPCCCATRSAQGHRRYRRLLDARRIGRTRSRSDFEADFVAFLDAHDLPRPDLNVPMTLPSGATIVADAVWRDHRVIVELDVTATHGSERSFHDDRARDRELQATRVDDRRASPTCTSSGIAQRLVRRPARAAHSGSRTDHPIGAPTCRQVTKARRVASSNAT